LEAWEVQFFQRGLANVNVEFLDGALVLTVLAGKWGAFFVAVYMNPSGGSKQERSIEQTKQSPRKLRMLSIMCKSGYAGATSSSAVIAKCNQHFWNAFHLRRNLRPCRSEFLLIDYRKVELAGQVFPKTV
jgi:hypothetical protein